MENATMYVQRGSLLEGTSHPVASTPRNANCWRPEKLGVGTVSARGGPRRASAATVPPFLWVKKRHGNIFLGIRWAKGRNSSRRHVVCAASGAHCAYVELWWPPAVGTAQCAGHAVKCSLYKWTPLYRNWKCSEVSITLPHNVHN